jgi:hypothetical protein
MPYSTIQIEWFETARPKAAALGGQLTITWMGLQRGIGTLAPRSFETEAYPLLIVLR